VVDLLVEEVVAAVGAVGRHARRRPQQARHRQALSFGIHSADAGSGRVRRTGTELTWEPLS
jgi:uncharacterized membrane-anchored protein